MSSYIDKKFIQKQFYKEWDFYINHQKVDYNLTPLFYKIKLNLTDLEFQNYIKNFYEWVKNDNIFGYNILDKMFNFKEIELFKIEYKNKTYPQKDYKNAISWIKDFIQDNNFTIEELLNFNEEEDIKVFSLDFIKDYSKLNIQGKTIYFQHRNWGVDRMTKDKGNPYSKTEGWGKLKEKMEKLNPSIIFKPDGSKINKFLGSARNSQYYPINESNNSNL
jgi:hypothetical protein